MIRSIFTEIWGYDRQQSTSMIKGDEPIWFKAVRACWPTKFSAIDALMTIIMPYWIWKSYSKKSSLPHVQCKPQTEKHWIRLRSNYISKWMVQYERVWIHNHDWIYSIFWPFAYNTDIVSFEFNSFKWYI